MNKKKPSPNTKGKIEGGCFMYFRKRSLTILILILILLTMVSCRRVPPQRVEPRDEPTVRVYMTETGEIKEMELEEYLLGVLAGEMKNTWHIEALSAQAIIARTYTMHFLETKESKYPGADISTDIEEAQAWNAKEINDRIKEAINRTRGQVAQYEGEFIRAWFHANAGGKTASAKEGLAYREEEPPYIQVVDSPDLDQEDGTWKESFTLGEILQAANQLGAGLSTINNISIKDRGPSGRVVTFSIDGKEVSGPELRLNVGSQKMRSTFITNISKSGNTITMEGKGYGHGVGMPQWGAYVLAQQGRSAEQIIKHFFKGVEIQKLWD
jgi:stage II sporulation protein D